MKYHQAGKYVDLIKTFRTGCPVYSVYCFTAIGINYLKSFQWEMAEHCAEYATVLFKVNFPPFCTIWTYILPYVAGLTVVPQWVPAKQVLDGTLGQRTSPLHTPTRRWPWGATSTWTNRGSGRSRRWRNQWTSPSCTLTQHLFNLLKRAVYSRSPIQIRLHFQFDVFCLRCTACFQCSESTTHTLPLLAGPRAYYFKIQLFYNPGTHDLNFKGSLVLLVWKSWGKL